MHGYSTQRKGSYADAIQPCLRFVRLRFKQDKVAFELLKHTELSLVPRPGHGSTPEREKNSGDTHPVPTGGLEWQAPSLLTVLLPWSF
jgi:hypothetical protein